MKILTMTRISGRILSLKWRRYLANFKTMGLLRIIVSIMIWSSAIRAPLILMGSNMMNFHTKYEGYCLKIHIIVQILKQIWLLKVMKKPKHNLGLKCGNALVPMPQNNVHLILRVIKKALYPTTKVALPTKMPLLMRMPLAKM